MGKTKTAIIDDSVPQEEAKPARKKVNPNPELLEKEKAEAKKVNPNPELAEKEVKKSAKAGADSGKIRMTEKAEQKEDSKPQKSKKFQEASEKVERNKLYPLDQAVALAQETSYSKFDGSLELHLNLSVKTLRGLASLPFAAGKKLRVAAYGKGAADSGADIILDEDGLKIVETGKINFDVMVVTPETMPQLAKLAKVLGPRGLMPNPKNGTISADLKKAVLELQSGKVEYKSESKAPLIHLSIGKVSQPSDQVSQNIKVLLTTIGKSRIKRATISPTMGPGVKLDLNSI